MRPYPTIGCEHYRKTTHKWLGSEVMSPPPRPRRTGRATHAAPSSSSRSTVLGLRLHTVYLVFQSYVYPSGHLTFPLDKRSSPCLGDQPPGHVSPLSGWVLPYPAGYGFPRPFGCRRSLLGRPVPAVGLARSCDRVTGCLQTTTGLPRSA
jgi:hypothetical protein